MLRLLATVMLALALAASLLALALVAATGSSWNQDVIDGPLVVLAFSGVGLLVVIAEARSRIGWLLIAIGFGVGLYAVMTAVLEWDEVRGEPVPGAALTAALHNFLDIVALAVLIPRLLLLFPDGRPPSPRWRIVGWVQVVALVLIVLGLFEPGPVTGYPYENPLGISALESAFVPYTLVDAAIIFGALGGVVSLLVRFRSSGGIERTQLKWVAWGTGTMAACFVANGILVAVYDVWDLAPVLSLALCLFPLTVGVAVLRYRLFEIDRLIARTLVYAALTLLLGAAYVGLVLAGQAVFSSFAGGSNLAIAASTLVVAALFLPARSRLQRLVDRRFYRRRYDAQRTLEAFGSRLRQETELVTLTAELRDAVVETMQPADVAVWLRGGR
jgi:hypothetical protein